MDVEAREENARRYMDVCFCPKCPSFTNCARLRSQKIFCLKGRSPTNCIRERKGCACEKCPVARDLDLKGTYFCIEATF